MQCSKCGKTISDTAAFCGYCGQPVVRSAPEAKRFCLQCGAPNSASARFCGTCGAPLDQEPAGEQPVKAAPVSAPKIDDAQKEDAGVSPAVSGAAPAAADVFAAAEASEEKAAPETRQPAEISDVPSSIDRPAPDTFAAPAAPRPAQASAFSQATQSSQTAAAAPAAPHKMTGKEKREAKAAEKRAEQERIAAEKARVQQQKLAQKQAKKERKKHSIVPALLLLLVLILCGAVLGLTLAKKGIDVMALLRGEQKIDWLYPTGGSSDSESLSESTGASQSGSSGSSAASSGAASSSSSSAPASSAAASSSSAAQFSLPGTWYVMSYNNVNETARAYAVADNREEFLAQENTGIATVTDTLFTTVSNGQSMEYTYKYDPATGKFEMDSESFYQVYQLQIISDTECVLTPAGQDSSSAGGAIPVLMIKSNK